MLFLLPLVLALSSPAYPAADSLALKCSNPKRSPLGALAGQGRIRYRVATDGRPDTLTLRVVATTGMSAPAFRSAVVRILPTCRRKAGRSKLPVAVTQDFRFDDRGFSYGNAEVTPEALEAPDTLATTPPPDLFPGPHPFSSALLEERPRALRCPVAPAPQVLGNDLNVLLRQQRMREGEVRLRFVVGPTGRAMTDSITIVATSNPATTKRAIRTIVDCKFAPGRVAGVPVAVIMFRDLTMD
jgi:hypothetical protein